MRPAIALVVGAILAGVATILVIANTSMTENQAGVLCLATAIPSGVAMGLGLARIILGPWAWQRRPKP